MSDTKQRNEIEAKQGTTKPKLIYVLVAGLVLILVAFGAVWLFQSH